MRVRNQRTTLRRAVYDLLRSDGPRPEARPTQGAGGETLPASIGIHHADSCIEQVLACARCVQQPGERSAQDTPSSRPVSCSAPQY